MGNQLLGFQFQPFELQRLQWQVNWSFLLGFMVLNLCRSSRSGLNGAFG